MGYILRNSTKMLALAAERGFRIEMDPEDATHKRVVLELHPQIAHDLTISLSRNRSSRRRHCCARPSRR
jgi:hypothetical protein